jgi:Nickel-containing superoxide dismutase.
MKKYNLLIIVLLIKNTIFAHCQIPCGIYDDAAQIIRIKSDFETIRKSMRKISELSNKSDPLSNNQINRWILTKDQHADKIQKTISEYFLTQRVKADKSKKYINQVSTLHKLLVATMKCKQTVDEKNVNMSLELIDSFVGFYFDSHGLDHLNKIEN